MNWHAVSTKYDAITVHKMENESSKGKFVVRACNYESYVTNLKIEEFQSLFPGPNLSICSKCSETVYNFTLCLIINSLYSNSGNRIQFYSMTLFSATTVQWQSLRIGRHPSLLQGWASDFLNSH